jgi:hypothetical protein
MLITIRELFLISMILYRKFQTIRFSKKPLRSERYAIGFVKK